MADKRRICFIAADIKRSWKKVYFGAVPYLDAMLSLNDINDNYYADSARSVVLYFLSNATTWREPTKPCDAPSFSWRIQILRPGLPNMPANRSTNCWA